MPGGVSGALYSTIRAIIKPNGSNPYCVANELICTEIAHFLQLPFPPSAIVSQGPRKNEPYFASLNFNGYDSL